MNIKFCSWINAELSALLGALFRHFRDAGKVVYLSKFGYSAVETIFKKNGFLKYYGVGEKIRDTYNSTIPFLEIRTSEMEHIGKYLINHVWPKLEEKVSNIEIEVIKDTLFEVIYNIEDHSGSQKIFMCGQYYHANQELVFTVADIGISIPIKYNQQKDSTLDDLECIDWAVKKGNSTKDSSACGLGLYNLKQNISGKGKLQIVSNYAYWEIDEDKYITRFKLNAPYPGILINLTFALNCAYTNHEKMAHNSSWDDLTEEELDELSGSIF